MGFAGKKQKRALKLVSHINLSGQRLITYVIRCIKSNKTMREKKHV